MSNCMSTCMGRVGGIVNVCLVAHQKPSGSWQLVTRVSKMIVGLLLGMHRCCSWKLPEQSNKAPFAPPLKPCTDAASIAVPSKGLYLMETTRHRVYTQTHCDTVTLWHLVFSRFQCVVKFNSLPELHVFDVRPLSVTSTHCT